MVHHACHTQWWLRGNHWLVVSALSVSHISAIGQSDQHHHISTISQSYQHHQSIISAPSVSHISTISQSYQHHQSIISAPSVNHISAITQSYQHYWSVPSVSTIGWLYTIISVSLVGHINTTASDVDQPAAVY